LDLVGTLIQSAKDHFSLFLAPLPYWENQPCILAYFLACLLFAIAKINQNYANNKGQNHAVKGRKHPMKA